MTQKLPYRKHSISVIKRMPWITFSTIMTIILTAVITGIFPFVFTKISHYAIINNKVLLKRWIIIGIVESFAFFISMIIDSLIIRRFKSRVITILRVDYVQNVYHENLSKFSKEGKGHHWDNLTNTLNEIAKKYFVGLIQIISSFITVMVTFVSIATLNVYIGTSLVVVCVLSRAILVIFDRYLKVKTNNKAKSRKKYNDELNDLTLGIETLFWNNSLESLGERVAHANENIQKTNISYTKTEQGYKFVNEFVANALVFIVLSIMAIFMFKTNTSIITLFLGIFLALSVFQKSLSTLVENIMGIKQVKKIKENPEFIPFKQTHNIDNAITFNKSIEVKDLTFNYEDEQVLKDVSFKINKGNKIAIVGKSGSGKSTLTNLLLKQLKFDHGSILFDKTNIKKFDEQAYLNNISYANNHNLIIDDTFENNMLLFGGGKINLPHLKEMFNLNFIDNKKTKIKSEELSTGQQQRINLARLWVNKKPIIILDECFGNLDKKNANLILRNIVNDKDVTLIMISHHLTPTQTKLFNNVIKL